MSVSRSSAHALLATALVTSLTVGCEQVKENPKTSGVTIGGASGAAAGAVLAGSNNRLLGALIGGALGAGGGYLIGTEIKKGDQHEQQQAITAAQNAESHPATAAQARAATTADINGDGFVTMDEVVAMKQAGFSDQEMLSRLQKTGMFFELTPQQQSYLRTNGVSDNVVAQMQTLNADARQRAAARVSQPAGVGSEPISHQ